MRPKQPFALARRPNSAAAQAFGAFATLLLLRTGTLAAPVAAHVFCNWQGFPNLHRLLQRGVATRALLAGGVIAFVAGVRLFCAGDWEMR